MRLGDTRQWFESYLIAKHSLYPLVYSHLVGIKVNHRQNKHSRQTETCGKSMSTQDTRPVTVPFLSHRGDRYGTVTGAGDTVRRRAVAKHAVSARQ